MKSLFNKYFWYGLIALLSLVTLFFMPMLGTEVGLEFILPNTTAGWIIWSVSNVTASILNVLMFHSFIKQGKVNILEHPNYVQAQDLLKKHDIGKIENPRSPEQWTRKQYSNKATTLFIFTLLGTISFGNAILSFNPIKFLAQLLTLIIGLVFGFIQMKSTEEYWTLEYLDYAKYMVEQKQLEEKEVQEAKELLQDMLSIEEKETKHNEGEHETCFN